SISLRALSAAVARLPVASTLYSTWTSSTMTTGLRSVGATIALLSRPEEDRSDGEQAERPQRGVEPVLRLDLVGLAAEQDATRQGEELVDRLEVGDAKDRRHVLEAFFDA